MNLLSRRILVIAAGVVAGLIAWPFSELLIGVQSDFPSYLVFIMASGALYGALFGLAFGSVDGIAGGVSARKWLGLATGSVAGLVAGAIGAVAGQAIYLAIGQAFLVSAESRTIGLPLARGIGWAVMGALLGAAEGARRRSVKRAWIGALGGFIGGLSGGLLIEYGNLLLDGVSWTRPAGSAVLGLFLAGGFAIIERGFLVGALVLVTGPLRGREYPLAPGRTTIGRGLANGISLAPYEDVAARHAVVTAGRSGIAVASGPNDDEVRVNEERVDSSELKFDDVIDIGSARFVLKTP